MCTWSLKVNIEGKGTLCASLSSGKNIHNLLQCLFYLSIFLLTHMITVHLSFKSGSIALYTLYMSCPISRSCEKGYNKISPDLLPEPCAHYKQVSDFSILILSNIVSLSSDSTIEIVTGRRKRFFFPLQQLDLEKKTGMKFAGRSVSTIARTTDCVIRFQQGISLYLNN